MEGVSITEVAAAITRIEAALGDNLAIKEDVEKLKTSVRSMEHLLFESNAGTLGLAAVLAAVMAKSGVSPEDEDIHAMLDRLTPPTDLGMLNRDRAQSLYGAILKAAGPDS